MSDKAFWLMILFILLFVLILVLLPMVGYLENHRDRAAHRMQKDRERVQRHYFGNDLIEDDDTEI